MNFNILTLFPEALASYLASSILGRAQDAGLITVNLVNIRDYATDKHHTVDDTPYGGGAGMVMKVEPIHRALDALKTGRNKLPTTHYSLQTILLSARGEQFTQAKAQKYSQLNELTLICGRYEGVDQRVADHLADDELSVGPYVLAGGELPALTVLEATSRLINGVLGNEDSLTEESFHDSLPLKRGGDQEGVEDTTPPQPSPRLKGGKYKEYPQYTKPADYQGWTVPDVLLSGNHEEIKKWREEQRQ